MAENSDSTVAARAFVFAYGSLMAPSSVRESLADFDLARCPPIPARLLGYRKAFSAIQPNLDRFVTAEGAIPPYVAYLNVEPAGEGDEALGALLAVSPEDLALLDRREQGYTCLDVTGVTELLEAERELGANDRVFVFSFPAGMPVEVNSGGVAFGADYERTVMRACCELDACFGGDRFGRDFSELTARYSDWPRLLRSNQRSIEGYR